MERFGGATVQGQREQQLQLCVTAHPKGSTQRRPLQRPLPPGMQFAVLQDVHIVLLEGGLLAQHSYHQPQWAGMAFTMRMEGTTAVACLVKSTVTLFDMAGGLGRPSHRHPRLLVLRKRSPPRHMQPHDPPKVARLGLRPHDSEDAVF